MRLIYNVLLLLAIPFAAHASLIGTASATFNLSVPPPAVHEANVAMSFDLVGAPPALFDDVVLTETSAGLVLTATALTDTDFNGIATALTNGTAETLVFATFHSYGSRAFTRRLEATWFSLGTNDFAGWNIDTITLTVDDISFEDTRDWMNYSVSFTVRVYGEQSLPVARQTWGAIKAMYRQ